MRKIAYILSFGHSGSTLLSLILEQHQQTISIGEFNNFSKKLSGLPRDRKCSCGDTVDECLLWKDFYQASQENSSMNINEEYSLLLDSFNNNFSDETVIVDSSKVIKNVLHLQDLDNVDLRVIYLIKDVRSFLVSTKRKALKREEKFGLWQSLKHAYIWYRDNQYSLNYLEQNGINHLKMSYEELCLYPQEANESLFSFLDLEASKIAKKIDNSQGHMLFGNRMRNDSNKNVEVKYDNVWFTDTLINIIGAVMPRVAKFNRKVTYSNNFDQIWRGKG